MKHLISYSVYPRYSEVPCFNRGFVATKGIMTFKKAVSICKSYYENYGVDAIIRKVYK